MDDREAGRYWEESAEAWASLSSQGFNIYDEWINRPALLDLLPDVSGLDGVDLGCAEGGKTALVAARCRSLVGVDLSPTFLRYARSTYPTIPLVRATAQRLPFRDGAFDFVLANLSLMDMPRPDLAVREGARILKRSGFFQFSITHPCTTTPIRRHLRDENGRTYAFVLGGYFDRTDTIEEWLFSGAPEEAKAGVRPFRLPVFRRTLADWLNMVADAGLRVERAVEPCASSEAARQEPGVADSRVAPYFLHLRCRKV